MIRLPPLPDVSYTHCACNRLVQQTAGLRRALPGYDLAYVLQQQHQMEIIKRRCFKTELFIKGEEKPVKARLKVKNGVNPDEELSLADGRTMTVDELKNNFDIQRTAQSLGLLEIASNVLAGFDFIKAETCPLPHFAG